MNFLQETIFVNSQQNKKTTKTTRSRGFVIVKINESNFANENTFFRNLKLFHRIGILESDFLRRFASTINHANAGKKFKF